MNTVGFALRPLRRPRYGQMQLSVDGADLRDLVRDFELPLATAEGRPELAGQYAGFSWAERCDPARVLRYYLGRPDGVDLYRGRTEILVCSCGEMGCWPLLCRIEAGAETVRWSDWQQHWRSGLDHPLADRRVWDYTGFGPFVFDRAEYEAALLAALERGIG